MCIWALSLLDLRSRRTSIVYILDSFRWIPRLYKRPGPQVVEMLQGENCLFTLDTHSPGKCAKGTASSWNVI
jgi:hypothetical protein